MKNFLTFEDIIFHLQKFWQAQGCILVQPVDLEVGAGTFHPATLLKSLGKKNGIVLIFNNVEDLLMEGMVRTPIECNNIFNFKFY